MLIELTKEEIGLIIESVTAHICDEWYSRAEQEVIDNLLIKLDSNFQ